MDSLIEKLSFEHQITLSFGDLQDNLYVRIQNKLAHQKFYEQPFEVVDIIEFYVKDMIVNSNNTIICNLNVIALCNNPRVGKIVEIRDFEIRKNTIIYNKNRIQIIAETKPQEIKTKYHVQIDEIKIVCKNILCVAVIVY